MRERPALSPLLAVLLAALAVTAGCTSGEKTERGLRYMPDMYQSPALKSQEAYVREEVDIDGPITREIPGMLTPPVGTVPRNFVPYHLPPEAVEAANAIENPVAPTRAVLRHGQDRFETFCAVCHGRDGNAVNGYVVEKLSGVPSLNNRAVAEMSDGYIFHVLTHGVRRMPDYRSQLHPEERWAVIHYLRVLQQAAALDSSDAERRLDAERRGEHDAFKPVREPVPEYLFDEWPEAGK